MDEEGNLFAGASVCLTLPLYSDSFEAYRASTLGEVLVSGVNMGQYVRSTSVYTGGEKTEDAAAGKWQTVAAKSPEVDTFFYSFNRHSEKYSTLLQTKGHPAAD